MDAPAMTVVVPSVNGWPDLEPCLRALDRERLSVPLEVLVPQRCGPAVTALVSTEFPWARVIPVPAGMTIPAMRALAFSESSAPTVAVIEDHVQVTDGWASKLIEARRNGARVIGGGIENAATERLVDWAAFICEYSHTLDRQRAGPGASIAGNNTAYDRALLVEHRAVIARGQWEHVLHEELRQRGVVLWHRPDILALHKKHFTVREYLGQRFLYSRSFAGAAAEGAGVTRRVYVGARAAALPPVLLFRIVTRTWRGGAHRRQLLISLPLLVLFTVAWGAGEIMGSWFGSGDALSRVT